MKQHCCFPPDVVTCLFLTCLHFSRLCTFLCSASICHQFNLACGTRLYELSHIAFPLVTSAIWPLFIRLPIYGAIQHHISDTGKMLCINVSCVGAHWQWKPIHCLKFEITALLAKLLAYEILTPPTIMAVRISNSRWCIFQKFDVSIGNETWTHQCFCFSKNIA